MRIVGIEGTAWAASAALYDSETDEVVIESDPYEPDSGGIHPREAAEHMGTAIPEVVATVLDRAAATDQPTLTAPESTPSRSPAGRGSVPVSASSAPPRERWRSRCRCRLSASTTWWRTWRSDATGRDSTRRSV